MPSISAEGVLSNRLEGELTELSRFYQWDRGFSVCLSLPLMSIRDDLLFQFLFFFMDQFNLINSSILGSSSQHPSAKVTRTDIHDRPHQQYSSPGQVGCSIYMKDGCLIFLSLTCLPNQTFATPSTLFYLPGFNNPTLAILHQTQGLFEPYFCTRSSPSQSTSVSLLLLLFPDPLPTVTLMDRSKLVRGRLDSDASDMQYLRSLDAQLRQEAGRQFQGFDNNQDFTKHLIMGQGGTLISVHNGDLLLVVRVVDLSLLHRPGHLRSLRARLKKGISLSQGILRFV